MNIDEKIDEFLKALVYEYCDHATSQLPIDARTRPKVVSRLVSQLWPKLFDSKFKSTRSDILDLVRQWYNEPSCHRCKHKQNFDIDSYTCDVMKIPTKMCADRGSLANCQDYEVKEKKGEEMKINQNSLAPEKLLLDPKWQFLAMSSSHDWFLFTERPDMEMDFVIREGKTTHSKIKGMWVSNSSSNEVAYLDPFCSRVPWMGPWMQSLHQLVDGEWVSI